MAESLALADVIIINQKNIIIDITFYNVCGIIFAN
jgi:hypothetical protein